MFSRLKKILIALAFAACAIFFCILSRNVTDPEPQRLPAAETFAEKSAGRVRIASMNCRNYLTTNRHTADGKYKRRWAKPLAEREAMRRVICEMKPDVLALQKIGDEKHLDQLAEDLLRKTGMAFVHRACLKGRDTHRRVGIISRIPFEKVLEFPEKEKMSRGVLGAEFRFGERRLRVFTLHLKSKINRTPDDPECAGERRNEAVCAGKILSAAGGELCVLLGDFNDTPESEPIRALARESGLKRLVPSDSSGETWTYCYRKTDEKKTFDHYFISPQLEKFKIPQSEKIADDEFSRIILSDGKIVYASDHRMIFADFLLP